MVIKILQQLEKQQILIYGINFCYKNNISLDSLSLNDTFITKLYTEDYGNTLPNVYVGYLDLKLKYNPNHLKITSLSSDLENASVSDDQNGTIQLKVDYNGDIRNVKGINYLNITFKVIVNDNVSDSISFGDVYYRALGLDDTIKKRDYDHTNDYVVKKVTETPITSVSISSAPTSLTVGDFGSITAVVSPTNTTQSKDITFSSSNSRIVGITSTSGSVCKISANGAGTATITAKSSNGKTATCKITVNEKVITVDATSITLNKNNISLEEGKSQTVTATIKPTNTTNKTVTWTSSNTKIATVSNGKITAIKEGSAIITAKTANGKTAKVNVTVTKPIPITSVKINKTTARVFTNGTVILSSTIAPTNTTMDKTVTWTSSNTKLATVDQNGRVNGKSEGEVVITAKSSNGKTATCKVTVIKKIPITSIKINKTTARVFINGTIILSSTISPSNTNINKTITWSSSNSSIATVDENGKVVGKKAGIVNITAKTSNGKTATCKVTVIKKIPITSIKLNKTSETIFVNKSTSLTVTINPSNANTNKTITWTSSNTKIATVDKNGNIKGLKAGTVTITAKSSNGKTATCKIIVKNEITKPNVLYSTHVQDVGWQNYVKNGAMAGTTGQSLRLEGIKVKLENNNILGDIEYRTHVQDIGWQDYVKNDGLSGTTGRSLRLEAISIRLTGQLSEYFDIYYRVHCQDIGWMNWAKNGEDSGSAGYSYRLEGIEIIIVEKGSNPPSRSDLSTTKSFISK